MSVLPESEGFQIITPLSPEAVMERVRAFTQAAGNRIKGKKIYFGFLKKDSFEITRKIDRKAYQSSVPYLPIFKFMPGFVKGVVRRGGSDDQSIIDITVQAKKAISGVYRQAFALILFPVLLVVAIGILVPLVLTWGNPNARFDWEKTNWRELGAGLGSMVGGWVGVSAVLLIFSYLSVGRYKTRYAEIAAFEKKALADLFEGKLQ